MTDPLSKEQLAEIAARVAAATPGPWVEAPCAVQDDEVLMFAVGPLDDEGDIDPVATVDCEVDGDHLANTVFIASARTDVPALLAEVERLRSERDQFADRVDTLTAVAKSNKRAHAGAVATVAALEQKRVELEQQLTAAQGEAAGHREHAAALLRTAQLATEYRVPAGDDWLLLRREPTGDRWAILASHRAVTGDRMAYVDGRWQPLPLAGPDCRWAYETADDAIRDAARLAEGGERP